MAVRQQADDAQQGECTGVVIIRPNGIAYRMHGAAIEEIFQPYKPPRLIHETHVCERRRGVRAAGIQGRGILIDLRS